MTELFDIEFVSSEPNYIALRDDRKNTDLREYCSELWKQFKPYADEGFAQQFALHPHRRFWEMYLGVSLMLSGFDLRPRSSSHGPDIHLILDGGNVWIEATAPSEGVGEDAVPTLDEHSGYVPVPEDNVILRYTSSISEKMQRLDNYIETNIVGPNDFYIIAINGARIEMSLLDGPIPAIVRAVYPIGDQQVTIDTNKMEVIEERYATRRAIRKASGSPVSTQSFIDPTYSGISGVLYGRKTISIYSGDAGEDLLYVHNYVADNRMETGWLGAGGEYWVEDERLRSNLE